MRGEKGSRWATAKGRGCGRRRSGERLWGGERCGRRSREREVEEQGVRGRAGSGFFFYSFDCGVGLAIDGLLAPYCVVGSVKHIMIKSH